MILRSNFTSNVFLNRKHHKLFPFSDLTMSENQNMKIQGSQLRVKLHVYKIRMT